jgi:octaprenyl-diphosphate synthase
MDLQYTLRLEKIEAVLKTYIPEQPGASWIKQNFPGLEETVSPELVRALTLPGWDLFSRGGKRWRPLLLTLICEGLGGGDAGLSLVPVVEFSHNASLIHDDIEDNSDERRGKPAVHLLYGADTAINGGSFLYFLPLNCIASWNVPPDLKNTVYALWGDHIRRLHLGQAMDIYWHRDFFSLPRLDEYDRMCRLKTGCLARFAALLGVWAATGSGGSMVLPDGSTASLDKPGALAELLGEAAENLGVGFQILDDVKNLTTGVLGKKRGDDIVEGKKSLPVLLYLHRGKNAPETVARCFSAARSGGSSVPEVEELICRLEEAGVLEDARERGLVLIQAAREAFGNAPLREEYRWLLTGLIDLII